jgi:hypothetical protein
MYMIQLQLGLRSVITNSSIWTTFDKVIICSQVFKFNIGIIHIGVNCVRIVAKCNSGGIDDRGFCNVTFTCVGLTLNCFAC